jgi:hypothetical protein
VLRGSPLLRPGTVRRCCEPNVRPRRRTATLSLTIHPGGGFALNLMLRRLWLEVEL